MTRLFEMPVLRSVALHYGAWIGKLCDVAESGKAGSQRWNAVIVNAPGGLELYLPGARAPASVLPAGADATAVEAMKAVLRQRDRLPGNLLLRLSRHDVIERTLQVPKAASDVLDAIVQNQIERIVPWPEGETRYGIKMIGPSGRAPGQLDVRVIATSRSVLDTALERLRALGVQPGMIDYAPDEHSDGIEVLALGSDARRVTARSLNMAVLAALLCSMAAAGVGLALALGRAGELASVNSAIAEARRQSEEAVQLRAEGAKLLASQEWLFRRKLEQPATMLLIEALSRALPDSAYLTEIIIQGTDVRIVGRAQDASALISRLEETPELENVAFTAPTLREKDVARETFAIGAKAAARAAAENRP
jgi:general secretion pathway protein L